MIEWMFVQVALLLQGIVSVVVACGLMVMYLLRRERLAEETRKFNREFDIVPKPRTRSEKFRPWLIAFFLLLFGIYALATTVMERNQTCYVARSVYKNITGWPARYPCNRLEADDD